MKSWRRVLKGHAETEHIKYFNKCNFTKMADHLAEQAEIKKAMTGDQKKAAKASCLPPPHARPTLHTPRFLAAKQLEFYQGAGAAKTKRMRFRDFVYDETLLLLDTLRELHYDEAAAHTALALEKENRSGDRVVAQRKMLESMLAEVSHEQRFEHAVFTKDEIAYYVLQRVEAGGFTDDDGSSVDAAPLLELLKNIAGADGAGLGGTRAEERANAKLFNAIVKVSLHGMVRSSSQRYAQLST